MICDGDTNNDSIETQTDFRAIGEQMTHFPKLIRDVPKYYLFNS